MLPGNAKVPGGLSRLGRVRHAVGRLRTTVSSSFLNVGSALRQGLLLRGRQHWSDPHPGYSGPPEALCFTVPPWRPRVMGEALASILFTNLFWVGLWDLLDNTLFPDDTTGQMLLLVVLGVAGLYLTDSLYDPPQDKLPTPSRRGHISNMDAGGIAFPQPRGAQSTSNFYDVDDDMDDGELVPLTAGTPEDVDVADDVVDQPCIPPRFEPRRFGERVIASAAAVLLWTGIWNQIDSNMLPTMCSYNACKTCPNYGEFPCAWYKIAFVFIGLAGQFVTRTLYTDAEVNYAPRDRWCCCGPANVT